MAERRADPAQFLERAADEEKRKGHGKLKIFFGAAPGVGKTYAMLEDGRRLYARGIDVVIGHVEPHKRSETAILTLGLEVLPPRTVEYRGTKQTEFDLEAALARRPTILLLDELAHTNLPGGRFGKRHEDSTALLEAGINVYTTLNVQHLESLNDVVAQITGVAVRETVPDSIFDEADEVELLDLPPDALLERLREGKVYVPDTAREAMLGFFRPGNLTALRELALRRTAQWVDERMRFYKSEQGIGRVWPASERILVAVGADPLSPHVLRAAKRLAIGLRADLIAVHVETPIDLRMRIPERDRLAQTLRLAESLDAETVSLTGPSVAAELIAYARSRNVTKIVLGRSRRPAWLARLAGSVTESVLSLSEELDVYVIHGEEERAGSPRLALPRRRSGWKAYVSAAAIVAVVTGISSLVAKKIDPANVAMLYLVGVMVAALTCGRLPSVLASLLSVAAFDYFFVPPQLTFAVSDTQYLITFLVMLAVGLLISSLTIRIRDQALDAGRRERRTAALYGMSRELAAARTEEEVIEAGTRHLRELLDAGTCVLLADAQGKLAVSPSDRTAFTLDATDLGAAQWVHDHGATAGLGTSTLPGARALFIPLIASQGKLGVLGLRPRDERPLTPNRLHVLETTARQLALALERTHLIEEAQGARMREETEKLRNALLSSVSHDLRTPLSVITGAATTLVQDDRAIDDATRRSLLESICEEGDRLNRIIENLVFATRLESGTIELHRDWIDVGEIVGAALRRLGDRIGDRAVTTFFPDDLPLVKADGTLLEQVVVNLVENALRHTPAGSPIEVSAWQGDGFLTVKVADRGPGLPSGDERRVFERFYRGPQSGGLGLGLHICRGIVLAHGGRIRSESVPGQGAAFLFSLPLESAPPEAPPEAS